VGRNEGDHWRTLGSSARIWAAGHHDIVSDSWIAFSGASSVTYNVASCRSKNPDVLTERCLQPVFDLGQPAIIMLAGAGLASAQKLADASWVTVGALPLMRLREPTFSFGSDPGGAALTEDELPLARELLESAYGLDAACAAVAVPDRAVKDEDMGAWGLYDEGQLVSCVTTVVEDDIMVVWSMATRQSFQGRGYGRRLLETILRHSFDCGATASLLQSSVAGERLYRSLGYEVVEYWQLWSRPRWVIGYA